MFLTGLLDRKGKMPKERKHSRIREGEYGQEYVLAWTKDTGLQKDIVITEIDIDNILRDASLFPHVEDKLYEYERQIQV